MSRTIQQHLRALENRADFLRQRAQNRHARNELDALEHALPVLWADYEARRRAGEEAEQRATEAKARGER